MGHRVKILSVQSRLKCRLTESEQKVTIILALSLQLFDREMKDVSQRLKLLKPAELHNKRKIQGFAHLGRSVPPCHSSLSIDSGQAKLGRKIARQLV